MSAQEEKKDRKRSIYEYMSGQFDNIRDLSYEEFVEGLKDNERRSKVHQYMTSQFDNIPKDFNEFTSALELDSVDSEVTTSGEGEPVKKKDNQYRNFFDKYSPESNKESVISSARDAGEKALKKNKETSTAKPVKDNMPVQEEDSFWDAFSSKNLEKRDKQNEEIAKRDYQNALDQVYKTKKFDPDKSYLENLNDFSNEVKKTLGGEDWIKYDQSKIDYFEGVEPTTDDYLEASKSRAGMSGLPLRRKPNKEKVERLKAERNDEAVNIRYDALTQRHKAFDKDPELKSKVDSVNNLIQTINKIAKEKPTPDTEVMLWDAVRDLEVLSQDKDLKELNYIEDELKTLASTKELIYENPSMIKKLAEKKEREEAQDAIDKAYENGNYAPWIGSKLYMMGSSPILRSATSLLEFFPTFPRMIKQATSSSPSYGGFDFIAESAEKIFDDVDNYIAPQPSKFNKPVFGKQGDGEWGMADYDVLINKFVRTSADMVGLLATGRVGSSIILKTAQAGKAGALINNVKKLKDLSDYAGLMGASVMLTQNSYYNHAIEAGLDPAKAGRFALVSTIATSVLEGISPNKLLITGDAFKRLATRNIAKQIAKGIGSGTAFMNTVKLIGKEISFEELQEMSQLLADKSIEYATNEVIGRNAFKAFEDENLYNEILETVLLTALVTLTPATVRGVAESHPDKLYKSALRQFVADKQNLIPKLNDAFEKYNVSAENRRKILGDIIATEMGEKMDDIAKEKMAGKEDPKYMFAGKEITQEEAMKIIGEATSFVDIAPLSVSGDPVAKLLLNDKIDQFIPELEEARKQEINEELGKLEEQLLETPEENIEQREEIQHRIDQLNDELITLQDSQDKKASESLSSINIGEDIVFSDDEIKAINESVISLIGELPKEIKEKMTDQQKAVVERAKTSIRAINTLSYSLGGKRIKIRFVQSNEEVAQLAKEAGREVGEGEVADGFINRDGEQAEIVVNINAEDASTVFHESSHPVTDIIKATNRELYDKVVKEASEWDTGVIGDDGKSMTLAEYVKDGIKEDISEDELNEEILTEYFAQASERRFANASPIGKALRQLIDELLKLFGVNKVKLDLSNDATLKDLAGKISKAMVTGKNLKVESKGKGKGKGKQSVKSPYVNREDIKSGNISFKKQTETENFKKWFGKSEVTDEYGDNPKVVYHGTTHDIDVFNNERSNPDGAMGKGYYFTSEVEDANINYATPEGGDITNRLGLLSDRYQSEEGLSEEEANKKASEELLGNSQGVVMPVFLKIEKPLDISRDRGGYNTEFTIERDYDYYKEMAGDELDRNDYDTEEEYNEALREKADEIYYDDYNPMEDGNGVNLIDAIKAVNAKYDYAIYTGNIEALREKMMDGVGEGFNAINLYDFIWDELNNSPFIDEGGSPSEFFREVIEEAGFDGIIQDANSFWGAGDMGMKGVNSGTEHYIVFKPNQIKSATGNNGEFSESNPSVSFRKKGNKTMTQAEAMEKIPAPIKPLPESDRKLSFKRRPELGNVKTINWNDMIGIVNSVRAGHYDSMRTGSATFINKKYGYKVHRDSLMGGVMYSFLKPILKAGLVSAFTNLETAVNKINAVKNEGGFLAIALQSHGSSFYGNKDFHSINFAEDGLITQLVKQRGVNEKEVLQDLLDIVLSPNRSKDDPSNNDFNTMQEVIRDANPKSVARLGKILGEMPFGQRNQFYATVYKPVAGNTKGFSSKYGLPTGQEFDADLSEPSIYQAESNDIIKIVKLDPIVVVTDPSLYTKKNIEWARSQGVKLELNTDPKVHHPSYPVAVKGKNVGVLNSFQKAQDVLEEWKAFWETGRYSNEKPPAFIKEMQETHKKFDAKKSRAQMAIAPRSVTEVSSIKELRNPENIKRLKSHMKNLNVIAMRVGEALGLNVSYTSTSLGGWTDKKGNQIQEASSIIDISGDERLFKAFGAIVSTLVPEIQTEFIFSTVSDRKNKNQSAFTIGVPEKHYDAFAKIMKEVGLKGFTYDVDSERLIIFAENDVEFTKISEAYEKGQEYARYGEYNFVTVERVENPSYRGIIEEVRSSEYYRARQGKVIGDSKKGITLGGIVQEAIEKLKESKKVSFKRNAPKATKLIQRVKESKNFQGWFGDSKIVDEDGDPLIVYHGTKADFDEFKPTKYQDRLIFFTTDPEFASGWVDRTDEERIATRPEKDKKLVNKINEDQRVELDSELGKIVDKYGWDRISEENPPKEYVEWNEKRKAWWSGQNNAFNNVMPVFLSVQNPFHPPTDYKIIEPFLEKLDGTKGFLKDNYHKAGNWLVYEDKRVIDQLKKLGYDGIWLTEKVNGEHETIAVFEPNQVKSAIGNSGEFDWNENNINFARRNPNRKLPKKNFSQTLNKVIAVGSRNRQLKIIREQIIKDPNWEEKYEREVLRQGEVSARLSMVDMGTLYMVFQEHHSLVEGSDISTLAGLEIMNRLTAEIENKKTVIANQEEIQAKIDKISFDPKNDPEVAELKKSLRSEEEINKYKEELKKQEEEIERVFHVYEQAGTTLGRLLRQYGELAKGTYMGVIRMVNRHAKVAGISLNAEQRSIIQNLASNWITATDTMKDANANLIKDPENIDLQEKQLEAEKNAQKAYTELARAIHDALPPSKSDLAKLLIMGNLLIPSSITVNTSSNFAFLPITGFFNASGELSQAIVDRYKTGKWNNDFWASVYYANTGTRVLTPKWMKALGYTGKTVAVPQYVNAWVKGAKGLVQDPSTWVSDISNIGVKSEMRTWNTLMTILGGVKLGSLTLGRNRDLWPRDKEGRINKGEYTKKLATLLSGANAELMFRLLYATDKPFRHIGEIAEAYRIAKRKGITIKNEGHLRALMLSFSTEEKEQVKKAGNEATFSQPREIAKIAYGFGVFLEKSIDTFTDGNPDAKGAKYLNMVKALAKVFKTANQPYVTVPMNLAQMVLEIAWIPATLAGMSKSILTGDPKTFGKYAGKLILGLTMKALAGGLYAMGLISGAVGDDDDAERSFKYQARPPFSINTSGLSRLIHGLDPTPQLYDEWTNVSRLGQLGMYLTWYATYREMLEENGEEEPDFLITGGGLTALFHTTMEQSFMQTSSALYEGLFDDPDKGITYFGELGTVVTSAIIPNNWTAIGVRPTRKFILSPRDNNLWHQFLKQQTLRIFDNKEDAEKWANRLNDGLSLNYPKEVLNEYFGTDFDAEESNIKVFPITNYFGNPVEAHPDPDVNPYWEQLTPMKKVTVTDPVAFFMAELIREVKPEMRGDILPVMSPRINVRGDGEAFKYKDGTEGKTYSLQIDPIDYQLIYMASGKEREFTVRNKMNDSEWMKKPPVEKMMYLKAEIGRINSGYMKILEEQLSKGISNGDILLDVDSKGNGTYKYKYKRDDMDWLVRVIAKMQQGRTIRPSEKNEMLNKVEQQAPLFK